MDKDVEESGDTKRGPKLPAYLFDPEQPDIIKVVYRPKEFYEGRRAGLHEVTPRRLGFVIKGARKRLNVDQDAMSALLARRGAIEMSTNCVRKLEAGKPIGVMSVLFIQSLASALGVGVGELVHARVSLRPRIPKKEAVPFEKEPTLFIVKAHTTSKSIEALVYAFDKEEAVYLLKQRVAVQNDRSPDSVIIDVAYKKPRTTGVAHVETSARQTHLTNLSQETGNAALAS